MMRSREVIESCGERLDKLSLEVLLDIRDLLTTGSRTQQKTEYTCDVCGRTFGHHLALAGHKRSHK